MKYVYMLVSMLNTWLSCINCKAEKTKQLAKVTKSAVMKICERLESSLSVYMATKPAASCTMINSYWYFTAAAQIRIIVTCVMNAVRESIKTRTKIGAIANGMI